MIKAYKFVYLGNASLLAAITINQEVDSIPRQGILIKITEAGNENTTTYACGYNINLLKLHLNGLHAVLI